MSQHHRKSRHGRDKVDIAQYVQNKVSRAMKQVELAKQQARRGNKSGGLSIDTSSSSSSSDDEMDACGITGAAASPVNKKSGASVTINKKSKYGSGNSVIVVQNSQNVQIGNNNLMIVNNGSRKDKVPEEDLDEDVEPTKVEEVTEAEKKILESSRLVTAQDLTRASSLIGKNWKRIARNLQVKDEDIERISMDYHNDSKERIYRILVRWKETKANNATLGTLVKVMYEVDCDKDIFKHFSP